MPTLTFVNPNADNRPDAARLRMCVAAAHRAFLRADTVRLVKFCARANTLAARLR